MIGETDADHQELLRFCAEWKFQRMGVFAYSEEDGTPAASFPDQACRQRHWQDIHAGEPAAEVVLYLQVPEDVREARRDELVAQQQDISAAFAESLIGREVSAAAGAKCMIMP